MRVDVFAGDTFIGTGTFTDGTARIDLDDVVFRVVRDQNVRVSFLLNPPTLPKGSLWLASIDAKGLTSGDEISFPMRIDLLQN
jgi:hypothetical protein